MTISHRLQTIGTVMIFILALLLPSMAGGLTTTHSLQEHRLPHPFPSLADGGAIPRKLERFYADRSGFRTELLQLHHRIWVRPFRESASAEVWAGKDGWLFLNVSDPEETRRDPVPLEVRYQRWADEFARRRDWCNQREIVYLVVLVPEKSSIYPEYLGPRQTRHPPPKPIMRIRDLLAYRRVNCIEAGSGFSKLKQITPLYFATDSHWTPDGARYGYHDACYHLRDLLPGFAPHTDEQYRRVDQPAPLGDLARMSGLIDRQSTELLKIWHCDDLRPTGGHVVFLHDSFGEAWFPFLQADFRHVTRINTHAFPESRIESERPQIVIQQIAARFLYRESPQREAAGLPR